MWLKLNLGIDLKTEPIDFQAGVESYIDEETKLGDEDDVRWWVDVSDDDSDVDYDVDDVILEGAENRKNNVTKK